MHLLTSKCHDFNYGKAVLPLLPHTQGQCIFDLFSSSSLLAGVRKFIQKSLSSVSVLFVSLLTGYRSCTFVNSV